MKNIEKRLQKEEILYILYLEEHLKNIKLEKENLANKKRLIEIELELSQIRIKEKILELSNLFNIKQNEAKDKILEYDEYKKELKKKYNIKSDNWGFNDETGEIIV